MQNAINAKKMQNKCKMLYCKVARNEIGALLFLERQKGFSIEFNLYHGFSIMSISYVWKESQIYWIYKRAWYDIPKFLCHYNCNYTDVVMVIPFGSNE